MTMFGACARAQTVTTDVPTPSEPRPPLWEAGVAVGGGRVSDYPGSNQSHLRAIALPMLIYRGPILRIENGGIGSRFVHTPTWDFELTGTAAFNARNDDARAGMPGLDYLFGIGPQWVYKGWLTPAGGPSLHLKWHALMSTNFKRIDQRGYSISPELRWHFADVGRIASAPVALTLSVQPTWASAPLQRYFYEVKPSEATPTRAAYAVRAGYLGTDLGASIDHRLARNLSWFAGAQIMSLRGTANEASPLMRSRLNVNVGAGLVWTPWRSDATAPD